MYVDSYQGGCTVNGTLYGGKSSQDVAGTWDVS